MLIDRTSIKRASALPQSGIQSSVMTQTRDILSKRSLPLLKVSLPITSWQTTGQAKQSLSWEETQFSDKNPKQFVPVAALAVPTESAQRFLSFRGELRMWSHPPGDTVLSLSLSFLHGKQQLLNWNILFCISITSSDYTTSCILKWACLLLLICLCYLFIRNVLLTNMCSHWKPTPTFSSLQREEPPPTRQYIQHKSKYIPLNFPKDFQRNLKKCKINIKQDNRKEKVTRQ